MGSKFIYKRVPFSNWQLAEYEKWLSDLAQEGLILEKVGFLWAKFKKGKPQHLTYRIDISNTTLSPQLKEQYGWEAIETVTRYSVYVSNKVNQDIELMENMKGTLSQLKSRNLGNKIYFGGVSILMLFTIFILLKMDLLDKGTPLLNFLRNSGVGTFFLLIIGQLLIGSIVFLEYRGIKRLIKVLEVDGHMDRKNIRIGIGDKLLNKMRWIGCIGFLIIAVYIEGYDQRMNLNEVSQPIPIVRLGQIEEMNVKLEGDNYYERSWHPLLLDYYEVEEEGTIEAGLVEEKRPYIYTEFYHLLFGNMKEYLIQEIKQDRGNEGIGIEQVEGLDEVHVLRNSGAIEIIAVKGNKVIFMRYRGNEGKEKLIEELVKVMGRSYEYSL